MNHRYDYIFDLNRLFDTKSPVYANILQQVKEEDRRKNKYNEVASKKKADRKFFSEISKRELENINPVYIPFFLNIGKELESGTEKEVYKEFFLKYNYADKLKNLFIKNREFLSKVVNFEDELKIIKSLGTKWAIVQVEFELEEVYFSKDDTFFYVIDNPLKKDKVYKIPYIAPSTWKGMLRWIAQKKTGDRLLIKKIFGNERSDEEGFSGSIRFYPSFFYDISIEIINPFDRLHRKGTTPILFEVVPKGSKSEVILTYIPKFEDQERFNENVEFILECLRDLIQSYGISAKRSSGWGRAKILSERVEKSQG